MNKLSKSLVYALAALSLFPLCLDARAQTYDDQQRQAIGDIVREYLLKNPEVLQDVVAELERRQEEARRVAQTNALRDVRDVLLNSPHSIVVGNPQGDITLVEFFDFNCPYCKRALEDVRVLIKNDPKLRIVLKDFPILGPDSVEASRVALAAKPQLDGSRLFEYHIKLMGVPGRVNGERAMALAKEMGLDMSRLQRDLDGKEIQVAIHENIALGDKLGLTGTPAFIVGEEIISGAVGVEPLRRVIAGVRQCGKPAC